MLLESVAPMEEGYHERKSQELIQIAQEIMNKTKKGYCGALHIMAQLSRLGDQLIDCMSNMECQKFLDNFCNNLKEFVRENKGKLLIVGGVIIVIIIIGYLWWSTPIFNIAWSALANLAKAAGVKTTEVVSQIAELAHSKIVALFELAFSYFKQYCTIPKLRTAFNTAMSWLIPMITKFYKILAHILRTIAPNNIQNPTVTPIAISYL